mmetsp:Transcript_9063/g.20145  ORF Transcript_9063/g.20145 Transcript_9063/m.20145 type:complete len:207 (+) Transcript_9063:56-676(+)
MGTALTACKGHCCHDASSDKEDRGSAPAAERGEGKHSAGNFPTPVAVAGCIEERILDPAEDGGPLSVPVPTAAGGKANSQKPKTGGPDKAKASNLKSKEVKGQQAQGGSAPVLTLAPREDPPPLKSELTIKLGLDRPGVKLQVLLDDGWVDCPEADVAQVCNQVAGGNTKFAIQSRGAMYIIDFTDPKNPTQENAMSKKKRSLRIL